MTRFEPKLISAGMTRLFPGSPRCALLVPAAAQAAIDGETGTTSTSRRARATSPSPTAGPSTRGVTPDGGARCSCRDRP